MEVRINPLVSIVMPAKNTAPYLAECLDSILDQSYPDWELIVVDDHSEDKTSDILKAYQNQDVRIRVLDADGNGIIDALKQAYDQSSGEYITRMDADDLMAPEKLEVLMNNLLEHGAGHLATGCVSYFCDGDIGDGYKRYAEWLNGLTSKGTNYQEIYKECVIPSPCWMLHREDFEKCGGFSSEVYPEDYDLCFRFYKHRMKVIPCSEELHHWRDYATRTSRTHEHYADNNFLELKVNYFLELDRINSRPMILWGAGKKCKTIAKLLANNGQTFEWVCNNPKKIGQTIYGVLLKDQDELDLKHNPQIIICIANPDELGLIKSLLESKDRQPSVDDFFFC